jgi:hypothetical protein
MEVSVANERYGVEQITVPPMRTKAASTEQTRIDLHDDD